MVLISLVSGSTSSSSPNRPSRENPNSVDSAAVARSRRTGAGRTVTGPERSALRRGTGPPRLTTGKILLRQLTTRPALNKWDMVERRSNRTEPLGADEAKKNAVDGLIAPPGERRS